MRPSREEKIGCYGISNLATITRTLLGAKGGVIECELYRSYLLPNFLDGLAYWLRLILDESNVELKVSNIELPAE